MADGAPSNDGHGGGPSTSGQDNNAQGERQSSTNRRHRRGSVLASGRVRPANARNPISRTRTTVSANAQAGVRIVAGPANVGGAPGVAIAQAPFAVGGNPAAVIQAGIANARGAGAIGPLVGAHVGAVGLPGPAPVQQNLGGGPAMVAPAQVNFDVEAGLSGPPLRRSEVGQFFTFP